MAEVRPSATTARRVDIYEALDRYLKQAQWNRLKAYGREKARERSIKPGDVERLIAEARSEHGR